MAKGLLNIPPREFGLDESSNPFRAGSVVPTKQRANLAMHAMPPCLTQAASVAEHHPVSN